MTRLAVGAFFLPIVACAHAQVAPLPCGNKDSCSVEVDVLVPPSLFIDNLCR